MARASSPARESRTFQEKGWNVVATMRSPQKETELTALEGVLVTRLDVTDESSIQAAIDAALERFGAIDVLVNNTGVGKHALLEQTSDAQMRALWGSPSSARDSASR